MSTTVTSTATFGMDAFASLAVVPSASDTRGTITFTSAAPNSRVPSFSAKLQAKEFGPFLAPMTVSIVVEDGSCTYQLTGNTGGYQYDSSGNVTGLVGPDGAIINLPIVHPRYWFHGAAALQCVDDAVFRDLVAGNDGAFGANLSVANAWTAIANGYVSTIDPVGGSTDSVIRIPGPNFDYMGQESLLIFWVGQVTPEGSDTDLMGTSSSTSNNGVRVRCNSTGRLTFSMYDTAPTSRFGTTTTDNAAGKPFVAGERHSFALLIDGQNRLQYMWVDGQINVNAVTISSAADVDTLSSATWNIGTASPAGGTTGVATKTQAFAGLKFLGTDTLPAIASITAVAQAFHRNPSALILAGAL